MSIDRDVKDALELKWVYVPAIRGWVREHDPRTQSGIVPATVKERDPEPSTHGGHDMRLDRG